MKLRGPRCFSIVICKTPERIQHVQQFTSLISSSFCCYWPSRGSNYTQLHKRTDFLSQDDKYCCFAKTISISEISTRCTLAMVMAILEVKSKCSSVKGQESPHIHVPFGRVVFVIILILFTHRFRKVFVFWLKYVHCKHFTCTLHVYVMFWGHILIMFLMLCDQPHIMQTTDACCAFFFFLIALIQKMFLSHQNVVVILSAVHNSFFFHFIVNK